MSNLTFPALIVAAVGSGLIGGFLFGFSNSIMAGLARLPPPQGIAAMQNINIAVINPLFLAAFTGTALLSLGIGGMALMRLGEAGAMLTLVAAMLYVIGTFGITMAINVPMNDALAAVGPQDASSGPLWANYLQEWTRWNHVRSVAALAAAALFAIAAANVG